MRLNLQQITKVIDYELVKLKAEALDKGHLKLATWGSKKQLIKVLRNTSLKVE